MTDDRPDHDIRPSPEALLAQTAKELRGRLKVFLGAAPGVGKTYEMLTQARQRRLEGVDTVIGVVETHGRIETDHLTKGFEAIPKKRLAYKGRVLAEMDIDAILQRKPKLVLVDELAHTNAPSSRHPKRYMDVEEILAAGIDVYTTLNVQHLESLNDVVAKITRIRVRETVPDFILDRADDVELVDLTPEDLLQRLKEGKVYVPTQAERAVRHYFMPGNLTALRELALRRTAQRVDDQMVNYMRAHAIQGPWEASERVLVSVSERPGAVALVRYARRLADRLRASWAAINVETAHTQRLSETERDRVAEALRVAQRLGGVTVSIPASNVAEGVLEYARANNFTHIVVSTAQRSRWSEMIRGSAAHEIIRRAGDISVHVVPEERTAKVEIEKPGRLEPATEPSAWLMPSAYAGSLAMVAVALGVGFILRYYLGVSNVALVFLTAVLASAVAYGLWPALFACLVSVLAFNFFFLPPLYTFVIADRENVITLVVFAVVAVIASHLTARVRAEAVTAQLRAKVTEELYLFSRKLTGVVSLDDLLWATAHQIALMLKVRVVLLLPEGESIAVRAGYPPEDFLDDADLAAAKWAWDHVQPAGRGADTLPGAKRLFLPMRTGRGRLGIIGLDSDRPGPILSPDQRRLLDALSDQAALAIERVNLMQDIDRARLTTETERLRTALLTSISHDLRTPLASILGSATSLKAYRKNLERGRTGRIDRHHPGRIRTPQPLHQQFARHDAARIGCDRAQHRGDGSGGCGRQRAAAYGKSPEYAPGECRTRFRTAHDQARCRAPGAGSVQPARQCREIFARRFRDSGAGVARQRIHLSRSAGRRRWNSSGRSRAHLRQVLPGPCGGSATGRHRPRPCHLPRLHRSDGGHDPGEQSDRSNGRRVHDRLAGSGERSHCARESHMTAASAPLRVLVVDDEPAIRRFLRTSLGAQGYQVLEAENARAALEAFGRNPPDVLVLDLGLPDRDGFEVIRELRAAGSAAPIVVLSSRADEAGKVQALDLGADDYVTKPFSVEELLARLRAALRHRLQQQGERPIFRKGDLAVDLVRRIVTLRDAEVKLSPREYDLLRLLVAHSGKVLTHKFILREVWGSETDVQYLRIYIRALRQKLEADPERPQLILTEQGVGYRLRGPD